MVEDDSLPVEIYPLANSRSVDVWIVRSDDLYPAMQSATQGLLVHGFEQVGPWIEGGEIEGGDDAELPGARAVFLRSPVLVAEFGFLDVEYVSAVLWSLSIPFGWEVGNGRSFLYTPRKVRVPFERLPEPLSRR